MRSFLKQLLDHPLVSRLWRPPSRDIKAPKVTQPHRFTTRRRQQRWLIWSLGLGCLTLLLCTQMPLVMAQSSDAVQKREDDVIRQYSLPRPSSRPPVVKPKPRSAPSPSRQSSPSPTPTSRPRSNPAPVAPVPRRQEATQPPKANPAQPVQSPSENSPVAVQSDLSQYILQFDRSPIVGNALQLEGILSQARLGFTRPRNWQVDSAKVIIRFRHSPALYADRSNLTVRLNNSHLGSLPLNRKEGEIGNVVFNVPANLIQDYNTLTIRAQQYTSKECSDPTDPTLWTEILPDSQVILNYRPQNTALDFANYPYPFLDKLGLEADRLAYLRPKSINNLWLTATSRFQASAARLTSARPLETRLINALDEVKAGEGLIVVGTPTEQPTLSELALPFAIKDNKVLDGNEKALPTGVGVLMLTTTENGESPVLVATGNDSTGVLKAVQMLAQTADRQLATGQAVLVNEISEVPSPAPRDWPGYLPAKGNRLRLGDLTDQNGQPVQDITVNGLPAPPPIQIPLRALPDDQFLDGSTFTLRYSYGPNIDTRRSSVTIRINGEGVGGERLTSAKGGSDSITVDVPPQLMTPTSNLEVQFFTYPQSAVIACGEVPDQPMWAKMHADSSFNLHRTNMVNLPDLKRLQTGFPLTAPQDLSQMAFVLPDNPTNSDVMTMLQVSYRMGRISQADSVRLGAYLTSGLPKDVREQQNLVSIGLRNRFPLPEVFQPEKGFALGNFFLRRQSGTLVQTLPDEAGVVQAVASPWNQERILLGLTAQTDLGLDNVQQMFRRDPLFAKLEGDTTLVKRTTAKPSQFDATDYSITALTQNQPRKINHSGLMTRITTFVQANWLLLPVGLLLVALLAYSISQVYLNRVSKSGELQ
ncbi:MAG TPA: cellulose biosynthesis cyclic di-GMP-binding regulatory protein BcsB [Leptolyngbyaceae cyanobacterium]